MLISIITVNLNDKLGLKRTIQNVRSQNSPNYEHIVIDGDSNDGSKDLLENYKHFFSYFVSEPDSGIYDAMNKGILAAKGQYLLFLNSGDCFYEFDSLKKLYNGFLGANYADIVYGDVCYVTNEKKEFVKKHPIKLSANFFIKDTLAHPSTLIKKSCFADNLYDSNLKIVADWKFFMLGVLKKGFTYHHVDTVVSRFYLNGVSVYNWEIVIQERRQIIKKHFHRYLIFHKDHFEKHSLNTYEKCLIFVFRSLKGLFK